MTVYIFICNTNCHYISGQCGIKLGNTGECRTRPNNGELCWGFLKYVRKVPRCYANGVLFLYT